MESLVVGPTVYTDLTIVVGWRSVAGSGRGGSGVVPFMRALMAAMACSLSGPGVVWFSMACFRCLVAVIILSVGVMVGVGRVWCKNLNVSVVHTAPASVTTLTQR